MINEYSKQKKFDIFRFESLVRARDNLNTIFHLWSTFFSVAIGALFVGYYTMANNTGISNIEIIVVTLVGYFVSLIWHWSCKGYYWWIKNWINLVINCEQNLPPRSSIYSCFFNKYDEGDYYNPIKPANISTGKLLGLFSFLVTVVWGFFVLYNILKKLFFIPFLISCFAKLFCLKQNWAVLFFYLSFFIISIFLSIGLCHFAERFNHDMKSHKNIPGYIYTSKED